MCIIWTNKEFKTNNARYNREGCSEFDIRGHGSFVTYMFLGLILMLEFYILIQFK
jgi:hypothetical protein